jgi:hypothetical protein
MFTFTGVLVPRAADSRSDPPFGGILLTAKDWDERMRREIEVPRRNASDAS